MAYLHLGHALPVEREQGARLQCDAPKRLRRVQIETHLPEGSTATNLEKPSGPDSPIIYRTQEGFNE